MFLCDAVRLRFDCKHEKLFSTAKCHREKQPAAAPLTMNGTGTLLTL